MLFDQTREPSCSYCRFGTAMGRDEIACIKRGIMHSSGYCGSYRYEPTKRIPYVLPNLDTTDLTDEDFNL